MLPGQQHQFHQNVTYNHTPLDASDNSGSNGSGTEKPPAPPMRNSSRIATNNHLLYAQQQITLHQATAASLHIQDSPSAVSSHGTSHQLHTTGSATYPGSASFSPYKPLPKTPDEQLEQNKKSRDKRDKKQKSKSSHFFISCMFNSSTY